MSGLGRGAGWGGIPSSLLLLYKELEVVSDETPPYPPDLLTVTVFSVVVSQLEIDPVDELELDVVVPLQLVVLLATEDVDDPEQDVDVVDECVVADPLHEVELTAVEVVPL